MILVTRKNTRFIDRLIQINIEQYILIVQINKEV